MQFCNTHPPNEDGCLSIVIPQVGKVESFPDVRFEVGGSPLPLSLSVSLHFVCVDLGFVGFILLIDIGLYFVGSKYELKSDNPSILGYITF